MSLFTIGHSNHSPEKFIKLIQDEGVDTIVDVRSVPYSQWAPFANRENLEQTVSQFEIRYLYMGDTLGGHIEGLEGKKKAERLSAYEQVRKEKNFQDGIKKLESEIDHHTVCILCAEEDPVACHRRLLIGKSIEADGYEVVHIRGDGRHQTENDLWKDQHHINQNQIGLPL